MRNLDGETELCGPEANDWAMNCDALGIRIACTVMTDVLRTIAPLQGLQATDVITTSANDATVTHLFALYVVRERVRAGAYDIACTKVKNVQRIKPKYKCRRATNAGRRRRAAPWRANARRPQQPADAVDVAVAAVYRKNETNVVGENVLDSASRELTHFNDGSAAENLPRKRPFTDM